MNVQRRRSIVISASAMVLAVCAQPPIALAVNECCVAGGSCYSSSGFPYSQSICPGGKLCGCTISGTNCEMRLTADTSSSSSSDCLTLGSGVILDMNGHSITCTGTDCGYAIKNTNSGGSSAKVEISNGFISGCWDVGIGRTGGTNATIDDMVIDLGSSCSNGISYWRGTTKTIGIYNMYSTISNTQVVHAGLGIDMSFDGGGDIVNCVLQENGYGVAAFDDNVIDRSLFRDNGVHVYQRSVSYPLALQGSTFVGATSCNAADPAFSCYDDLEDAVTLVGSVPTIVCDPSGDASRPCTIR